MDRLASCYFCGVAVEAPLQEYPVVPRDLRPGVEDQSTVVLCPECRRKLSTVVERVVDAATAPGAVNGPDTAQETLSREEDREATRSGPDNSVLDGFDHERPDLLEIDGAEDDEGKSAGNHGSDARAGKQEETTDDRTGTTDPAPNRTSETTEEQPGDENPTGASEGRAETDEREDSTDGATDETTAPAADADFSQSAYNRVVKLLQNREFPVDADDIQTVARSAYEIERRESEAVIDALIERDVIERDGEQLRRADE
ncbi:hypothetical protein Hrd1104_01505 [Halorhabdus sp. CBA1104]|uniref:hypothetical protein n=1 Tax=Halorhabdus sp. CBA1104 TaxID=1380432 RepID=UPI0012B19387|nr:hypothetical protein [Halorhabdus sp. CBA1104]QGN06099.1 hypothetical protein Hrd1104_01505 [Halorhabdus sp. CBA1104]